jgi:hypothetical protein
MANKAMEIRSALLKSDTTRNNLRLGMEARSEIATALGAIDRIGGLYDAIRQVHEAVNPQETVEARAMRYEKQFQNTVAEARNTALKAGEFLDSYARSIYSQAIEKAGLSVQSVDGPEIRSALRAMPQAERDKAVNEAFKRGDVEVLSSIYGRNPVTWGGTTKPLDKQFQLYVETAAPEMVQEKEALDKTMEGLTLAVDTFVASAEKWRDPLTAARGFQQAEEYEAADAALKAFLGPTQ